MCAAVNSSEKWAAPLAHHGIDASISVPGSKSITNRAYLLAAQAAEPTFVRAPLVSRDTTLMLEALSALGATYSPENGAEASSETSGVRIQPLISPDSRKNAHHVDIQLGNAGTVARFVPAIAGLHKGKIHFDGDDAIRRRPIAPLLEALKQLGLDVDDGGRNAPPFTVRGTGSIPGGAVDLDSSASSQFLSALLLAGPSFTNGVTVRLVGETPPSEPHIAMTLDLLTRFGATPERAGNEFHVNPTALCCSDFTVEPDLSTAAPFAIAAVVTGGTVRINGWPDYSTQPGDWLRSLLEAMEQRAELTPEGLIVTGSGSIPGMQLDLHDVGELTPVIAAMLCFAQGPSTISGVAHLRGHETDRLNALATELSALGGDVQQTADGLHIVPAPLHAGTFHTYHDHRLVMAAAILGLRIRGVEVENPATVGKTFPNFTNVWTGMISS